MQAVHQSLQKWGPSPPSGWFERELERSRCLVLLDGLDEVADPRQRQIVVDWVQQQMVAYARNRFVITSRPHGYRSNPLMGVTVFEVKAFTAKQVQHFVHNWYLANEIMSAQKEDAGVRMLAKEGAEDLLQRIRTTPTLAALSVNPLLLTMITTVHRFHRSLPGHRVELYAQIAEVFLGKRQMARGLSLDFTPAQKQHVLRKTTFVDLNDVRQAVQKQLPQMTVLVAQQMKESLIYARCSSGLSTRDIEDANALALSDEQLLKQSSLAQAGEFYMALVMACSRAEPHVNELYLGRNRNNGRIAQFHLHQATDQMRVVYLYLVLLRILNQVMDRSQRGHKRDWQDGRLFLLWCVAGVLYQYDTLNTGVTIWAVPDWESERRLLIHQLQTWRDDYLTLYLNFLLIQTRKQSKMPAFEGVRFVKVRKHK